MGEMPSAIWSVVTYKPYTKKNIPENMATVPIVKGHIHSVSDTKPRNTRNIPKMTYPKFKYASPPEK